MVCSAQTVHVPCVKIRTISKWTKTSFHLSLVSSYSIGCIENNFWACGTFVAPVHLSCTYTNTISKWTEMRFEFHPVHPKQFLSLWFVQRKPCTYLVSRLAQSPNGPKWDFTWPTSPRSFIGCVKWFSEPMVCSLQTVHLSCVKISTIFKRTKMSFRLSLIT
jgi:hypothetical protein